MQRRAIHYPRPVRRAIPIGLFIAATVMGFGMAMSGRDRTTPPGAGDSADDSAVEGDPSSAAPGDPSPPLPLASPSQPHTAKRAPPAPVPGEHIEGSQPELASSKDEDRQHAVRRVLHDELAPQVATVASGYGAIVALGARFQREAPDCDATAHSLERLLGDFHGALESIIVHGDDLSEADRRVFHAELEARYRSVHAQVDATLDRLGRECRDSVLFQRALHSARDARLLP